MLPFLNPPFRSIDPDARAFAARSGATDLFGLSGMARGIKSLGWWPNFVCWPMPITQNAGTGSTLYSFGGRGVYDITLVNGPLWTANGLSFAAASSQTAHTSSFPVSSQNWAMGYVGNLTSFTSNGDGMGWDTGGTYCILSWSAGRTMIIEQDGGTTGPATGETTGSFQAIFGARTQGGGASTGRRAFRNGTLNASLSSSGGTMTYPHTVFKVANSTTTATRAFGFFLNQNATDSELSQFYNIYKLSLGRFLSLP